MNRLETLSPSVVARLRCVSAEKQRAAALAACEFAIAQAGVQHRLIDGAMENLRKGTTPPEVQQSQIETLGATLDDEYFDLQEAAHEGRAGSADYLRKFAQARAVSAVLFASKSDPFEASTEAVYEAAAVVDDTEPLFSAVISALR